MQTMQSTLKVFFPIQAFDNCSAYLCARTHVFTVSRATRGNNFTKRKCNLSKNIRIHFGLLKIKKKEITYPQTNGI